MIKNIKKSLVILFLASFFSLNVSFVNADSTFDPDKASNVTQESVDQSNTYEKTKQDLLEL
jgi:hypothetical protein